MHEPGLAPRNPSFSGRGGQGAGDEVILEVGQGMNVSAAEAGGVHGVAVTIAAGAGVPGERATDTLLGFGCSTA